MNMYIYMCVPSCYLCVGQEASLQHLQSPALFSSYSAIAIAGHVKGQRAKMGWRMDEWWMVDGWIEGSQISVHNVPNAHSSFTHSLVSHPNYALLRV